MAKVKPFSSELKDWLKNSEPKTFARLEEVFGKRTFAIIFLVFMALPALPIPTGGITHVLEVLTILIAVQQMVGIKKLWVPAAIRKKELPVSFVKKFLPPFMRRVQWLETYSRRRGTQVLQNPWFVRFAGFCILGCTLGALLSLPFSGLDTLPALGVVIMALGLIVDDIMFFIGGLVVGLGGIVLEVTVGAALIKAIKLFIAHTTGTERLLALAILVVIVFVLLMRHRSHKI